MIRKEMKTKIVNKLGSRSGESISETLVALLISALALVMLAGVIASSARIVTKSRDSMKTYYNNCNQMVLMSAGAGSSGSTGKVAISGTGIVTDISGNVSYIQAQIDDKDVYYYRSKDSE